MISRRKFLKLGIVCPSFYMATLNTPNLLWGSQDNKQKALFYTRGKNLSVVCELCDNKCLIDEGDTGFCKSRENINGDLFSLTNNKPVAIHLDPIEKLPMKHILPGQKILCIGTGGCNYNCKYCINNKISQTSPNNIKGLYRTPNDIITIIKNNNISGIAFTYNEPTVAYEYMLSIFKHAKNNNIKTFLHTNCSMQRKPLLELLEYTDGVVVDLKSDSSRIHQRLTGKHNGVVKENLKHIHESKTFLEIVNLIVPTYNDEPDEIARLCEFVRNELSVDIPVHFSRFFPKYRLLNLPPTPTETICRSIRIGKKTGLRYVYANNLRNLINDTSCPFCKGVLIKRTMHKTAIANFIKGRCGYCGENIPGIWEI